MLVVPLLLLAKNSFADNDQFQLPPLEQVNRQNEAKDALSRQASIFVRAIRVSGSTLLTRKQLQTLSAPYVGRLVSMEELQRLRQQISQAYIERGYITSNALLPDQKVENGVVTFAVIEGHLKQIHVQGNKQLNPGYVARHFSSLTDKPVNLSQVQSKLLLLKHDPMIMKLDAELKPGEDLGTSILALDVKEGEPFQFQAAINNHRSPSIGAEQLELKVSYSSLTGWGDKLSAQVNKTEGLDEAVLNFLLPISKNTDLLMGYQTGQSEVIEEPFNAIDVESEFYDAIFGVRFILKEQLNSSVNTSLTLQKRQSKTFLFGQPFSFSEGVQDGVSQVSVLRWTTHWLKRSDNQAYSLTSTISQGLDTMGATINETGPDGRFITWLGQFQYAYRFDDPQNELLFRYDIRLSNQQLLPLEKLAIGGSQTVRGYRENTLIADQGMMGSLEYRFGIFQNLTHWGSLQGALFTDYGMVDNKGSSEIRPEPLSSFGAGLIWKFGQHVNAHVNAAKALRSIESREHNLQDSGIHLELAYKLH